MRAPAPARENHPGTRPEGARPDGTPSERESAQYVQRMFSDIAGRYDLLNRLLSFSLDRLWRRRTAIALDHILRLPHARVLDLCCGTGDLTLALKRRATHSCSPGAEIFGSDFAHPMLVRAAEKSMASGAAEKSRAREIRYFEADALTLPIADASLDLVTAAFGFRNLANYDGGLREMIRVLRSGGEVGILEFSEPSGALFGPLYRFYFLHVLPRVGGIISGCGAAYTYLPASVSRFPSPPELERMMETVGFVAVRHESWAGGVVTLHRGEKPE
jgi:demethylmenaquinone methyltransferase/2-methoxy-6-polyprenyl-1,4-benzoquinol methylase